MTTALAPGARSFTGVERAAVLMMLVGEEEAAEVAADPDAGEEEKDDASRVSETPSRGRA